MTMRRCQVDIAAVGPDKVSATRVLAEKLIELGHRRIVMFSREERRHPNPGLVEHTFLEVLSRHGIPPELSYNLPDWTSNSEGFTATLGHLFELSATPPTAIIVEESQFFFSAIQQLANRGLSAPKDVSIACTDDDPVFEMSSPPVTCIRWKLSPVINHIAKWVSQVSNGRISRHQKLTEASLIEGGTIGPVAQGDKRCTALLGVG